VSEQRLGLLGVLAPFEVGRGEAVAQPMEGEPLAREPGLRQQLLVLLLVEIVVTRGVADAVGEDES